MYDDIRFSWWDDDDNDDEYLHYDLLDIDVEDECVMCGKERVLNDKGYCAMCWTIWTS